MKRSIVLILFAAQFGYAQQKEISLNDCYDQMLNNYPLVVDFDIYNKVSNLKTKNLNTGWLPNAEFKAQATYQSEAFALEIDLPIVVDLPEGSRDQYKATVDINQLIYDWGRIKSAKNTEQLNLKVNQQSTQVELNKLKEQINKFYFAILVLQKNEELMNVMLSDINQKQLTVESGIKNGVLLTSDLNVLQAEKLKVNQNITQLINQRLAAIRILSEITGMDLDSDVKLNFSDYELDGSEDLKRPEHALFDYQAEHIDASVKALSKQNMPMVFAFGQLGYGKPGLNMLNDKFDSFYFVGIGLNWKFWDWNQNRRQREILNLNKNFITSKRESLDKQLNVALDNEIANITNYQTALITDLEIIKLREEITQSATSKLENGVITSTQYLTELNAETQAKINYETHKIQLVQSKVNYLYIMGKL
jgi:outer membrane protein TolC